jgi:ABC-2 type transport system permease protein
VKAISQAIWVEMLKARRSRMPLFTALGFALLPLALGFMMIILKDPELARRAGLITVKARITMGVADWPTYLGFLAQATAMGGIMIFSLVAIWVFGREYSDHTVTDLLALPTSRSAIVGGKFVVVAVWSIALTVMVGLVSIAVGAAVGLPPVSTQLVLQRMVTVAVAACLAIALVTPIAFFASAGHGYLPPIGAVLLAVFLAQLFNATGRGEYFPWAIPALYTQGEALGAVSYVILVLTGVAGVACTLAWWERADQTH